MGFNKTSLVNLGLIEERGRRRAVVHRFPQSVTIIFTFYYVLGEDISVDLNDDTMVHIRNGLCSSLPCLKPDLSLNRKGHNPKYGCS